MPSVKPKKGKKQTAAPKRKVTYEKVTAKLCIADKSLTADQAKEMLGWEEETEKVKFGEEYLLKDMRGKKVRCHYNVTNRPIYKTVLETLKQEILRQRWQFNGESIIIGRTALDLNGQHRLIALVLAVQEWEDNKEKWENWKSEPAIEVLVVFGVDESDKVVNTMDTCKPRSLADVIYRSAYFAHMPKRERIKVSRMADYAVRILWYRVGAGLNAFAPRRTHAESLAFIESHPKLLQCVSHIYEEDADGGISKYLSPGYASGMLYLMGSSTTDPEDYRQANTPREALLDWAMWERASEFWVLLAGGAKELEAVQLSLASILDDEGGSVAERCALTAKAWARFAEGKSVAPKHLQLEYNIDDDGIRTLAECPVVGGIDYGDPSHAKTAAQVADKPVGTVPTPEEIKQRAQQERDKQAEREQPTTRTPRKKKKTKPHSFVGKMFWVSEPNGEHWRGRVVEVQGKNARLKVAQGHEGAGNVRPALIAALQPKQPPRKG